MLGGQQSWQLIDPTSGFRVMSSWKSHENVIHEHLVTFVLGAKNETEQKNCMMLTPITMHGKGQYQNPTNTER